MRAVNNLSRSSVLLLTQVLVQTKLDNMKSEYQLTLTITISN